MTPTQQAAMQQALDALNVGIMKMTNAQRDAMQQILDALNVGVMKMNALGCAIECMPLHYANKTLREALAEPVVEPVPVGEVVAYKDNRHQFKRIKGYDGVIEGLPVGVKVYVSPPTEHLCKWPTCQTEEHQKNLADQVVQALGDKPPVEVPLLTERELIDLFGGYGGLHTTQLMQFRIVEQAVRQKAGIK